MKILNKCDFRNSYFNYLHQSICFHYKNKRHYINKDQGAGYIYLISGWCSATSDACTVTDTTERWK